MLGPPRWPVAGPLLDTRRSACATIGALAVAELFPGARSGTSAGAVTVAVLVMVPGTAVLAGSVPDTVNTTAPNGLSVTRLEIGPLPDGDEHTAPLLCGAHVQVALVNAGFVPGSDTVALLDRLGPALLTVS